MGKYWEIVKESYKQEKELAARKVEVSEKDFLPAALEILEKPASPLGRFVIWSICIFFGLALAWSIIGKIDVVAVAQGKIITIGQTKTIQSFEAGVVRNIYASNGLRVNEGDVLIELDSTVNKADLSRLREDLKAANLVIERSSWLLDAIESEVPKPFESEIPVDDAGKKLQEEIAVSKYREYTATRETLLERMLEKRAEMRMSSTQLEKIKSIIPLLEEQVSSLRGLASDGIASRFQYLEKEEALISRKSELAVETHRAAQIQASMKSLEKQLEQHHEEARSRFLEDLVEAKHQKMAVSQELVKAEETQSLLKIRSPVTGVIQQLAVHTIGGVVKSADPLMVVVPEDRELQADIKFLNKDIGFVTAGQDVEIKLESFPFTKYGVIHGELLNIDQDAIQDEKVGLVYPARISLREDKIMVNGRHVPLGPGMGLTAEVKIGNRRLVEFILAPLFRYKDESLRER